MSSRQFQHDAHLPDGWEMSTLGKFVAKRTKGIVPNKTPHEKFELYSVPSFETGGPEIAMGGAIGSNKQVVEEGTVLLCKINPRINRSWVVASHSAYQKIASTEWITFPANTAFEPKYLAHYLKLDAMRDFLAANASGVGGSLMRVKPATVADYPFPIAPEDQQKRIVAEIEKQFSRLDEAVANLKRVKANLKRYKAVVLKAAVEGKLTEEWRKAHPDVEPASELLKRVLADRRRKWEAAKLAKMNAKGRMPKDDSWRRKYDEAQMLDETRYPGLPDGWTWCRLEQLGEIIGGLTQNRKRKGYPIKMPYLRVANVYANELQLDEVMEIRLLEGELERVLLRKGDLLIVEGNGSRDQIGRLAIWDASINPCVHQNHLIKVRLVEPAMGQFILWWLLSVTGRDYIVEMASSTSGLYTLSISKVGNLPIPLPPLEEQRAIILEVDRRVTLAQVIEAELDTNVRRADRLRQSILQRAFSGGLLEQRIDSLGKAVLEKVGT